MLDVVFYDTTSIYFEGEGPEGIAEKGFSRDNHPEDNQVVIGILMTGEGFPIACEIFPGSMYDAKTLKKALATYQKILAYIVVLTTLFLYLLSTGVGTILYVKPLEQAYSPPSLDLLQDHDAIVILGGGIILGNEEVELGPHTLKRLLKGFELYKKLDKPIVLTGGSPLGRDSLTEAEVMATVLEEWGVDYKDIISIHFIWLTYFFFFN